MQEPTLRFQVEKTGLSKTLCNIWRAYPEWLREHNTFGVVPGISINGKELSNRFDLHIFSLFGRTNAERVGVFTMAFLQGENERSG